MLCKEKIVQKVVPKQSTGSLLKSSLPPSTLNIWCHSAEKTKKPNKSNLFSFWLILKAPCLEIFYFNNHSRLEFCPVPVHFETFFLLLMISFVYFSQYSDFTPEGPDNKVALGQNQAARAESTHTLWHKWESTLILKWSQPYSTSYRRAESNLVNYHYKILFPVSTPSF